MNVSIYASVVAGYFCSTRPSVSLVGYSMFSRLGLSVSDSSVVRARAVLLAGAGFSFTDSVKPVRYLSIIQSMVVAVRDVAKCAKCYALKPSLAFMFSDLVKLSAYSAMITVLALFLNDAVSLGRIYSAYSSLGLASSDSASA
ncbi:MAG: hypothetical protein QXY20_09455, partial [Thermofilum sp.]|uniref:hypothetical protein n=1 Tax=Thermofilum sp. TaxID=1961369 RepID=UPI00315E85B0